MKARDRNAAVTNVIGTPWKHLGTEVLPSSLPLIPEKITIASKKPIPAPAEFTNDSM
jgi:hypothetical protein